MTERPLHVCGISRESRSLWVDGECPANTEKLLPQTHWPMIATDRDVAAPAVRFSVAAVAAQSPQPT